MGYLVTPICPIVRSIKKHWTSTIIQQQNDFVNRDSNLVAAVQPQVEGFRERLLGPVLRRLDVAFATKKLDLKKRICAKS